MSHLKITELDIERDEVVGQEGGFLGIRRLRLRNRRADGSLSVPYSCDFVKRPVGLDAVVVALYHRSERGVRVLLREGLRPALALGRVGEQIPMPDRHPYLFFTELVAGIIEASDRGMDGIRARAAAEVFEEAGYRVASSDVTLLGAGSFPSPGSMPEKYWMTAVEILDPSAQQPLEGDGSAMEEGATTTWLGLDEAIAACVNGDIEDGKTELTLRRLRDRLHSESL